MFPVTLGTESGHIQSHVLIIRLERYFALLFSVHISFHHIFLIRLKAKQGSYSLLCGQ